MKKTWISIGIVVVVALAIALVIIQTNEDSEEIKIGAILPLTGSSAQYGQWSKNGADLAVEEINQQGGIKGRKIKILYEDSKTDAKEGVSAINNLYTIHKIQAFITESSGVVLAIAPIAETKKIVQLNVGAVNPQIREAGDYTFSNINDAKAEAYQMARFVFDKLQIRKLAILYANASYGIGARNAMLERFKILGGQIVADEGFEENSGDFRTQLTKIKSAIPEAIYVVAVTKDAAIILKQAKEIGLKVRFFSTTFFEGKDIIDIAGDAAEGTIYTSTALDTSSPDVRKFISNYYDKFGITPEIYSATAYDAIKILALAIEKVGYDGSKIKNFLYTVKDYPGISGVTTFDAKGAVEKPILFKIVRNRNFELYYKEEE